MGILRSRLVLTSRFMRDPFENNVTSRHVTLSRLRDPKQKKEKKKEAHVMQALRIYTMKQETHLFSFMHLCSDHAPCGRQNKHPVSRSPGHASWTHGSWNVAAPPFTMPNRRQRDNIPTYVAVILLHLMCRNMLRMYLRSVICTYIPSL